MYRRFKKRIIRSSYVLEYKIFTLVESLQTVGDTNENVLSIGSIEK